MSDDLKREQIREFFDRLTESERHRLMTGFAHGMFGAPEPQKAVAAVVGAPSTLVTQAELEALVQANRIRVAKILLDEE